MCFKSEQIIDKFAFSGFFPTNLQIFSMPDRFDKVQTKAYKVSVGQIAISPAIKSFATKRNLRSSGLCSRISNVDIGG